MSPAGSPGVRLRAALPLAIALAIACQRTGPVDPADGIPGRGAPAADFTLGPVPAGAATLHDFLRGYTDAEVSAATEIIRARSRERHDGPPVERSVTVRGRVFLDPNRNGRLDTGERGLADVLVTDGEVVTRTGEDGRLSFSFNAGDEPHHRFVAVTTPSGYVATTPTFGRIRSDEPDAAYSFDFGLADDARSRRPRFWFLTTSDTQVSDVRQMVSIAKAYAQMTEGPDGPAFLVTAGDLTSQGTHHEWDTYDFIRGASHVPVYDGYGGHDGNGLRPRSTVNYELRTGPPYYSWDYGGVHFVQLISEEHHLQPGARARQQRWLTQDLSAVPKGTPVIVVSHYPLTEEWFDARRAEGVNVLCQISGHFHTVMAGSRNGVPVLGSAPAGEPDWGAYGRAYRRVFVSPEGVTSEVRIEGQYQRLAVVAPGPTAPLQRQPVVVLAYDSTRHLEDVRCLATSPAGTKKAVALRKQGAWSWHGEFEPDAAGDWRFEIEATDSAGAVWRRAHTVRVGAFRLAGPAPDGEFPWTMAGDTPRRVGRDPGKNLYPLWVRHTGGVHVRHAAPAVSTGRVCTAVPDPNAGTPASAVVCFDARTGEELWRTPSPMGDISGAVTFHEDRLFALTGGGWVMALAAGTGRPLWQTPIRETSRAGRPLGATYTVPVPTAAGLLVADRDTPPVLISYATGALRQLDDEISEDKYGAFVTVHEGVMYSAQTDKQFAQSLLSGKRLWERPDDLKSSMGIVADGKFIFTGCCTDGGNVAKAIDARSGAVAWETSLPNPRLGLSGTLNDANPIPVVWDDLVLANGRDLAALDLRTGVVKWTVECGRDARRFERSQRQTLGGHSSPVIGGTLAYFGHDDTSVRAVDKQGRVVWEHVVGTPVHTAPALSGNLLFVHDHAGNLWCFAPAASPAP